MIDEGTIAAAAAYVRDLLVGGRPAMGRALWDESGECRDTTSRTSRTSSCCSPMAWARRPDAFSRLGAGPTSGGFYEEFVAEWRGER